MTEAASVPSVFTQPGGAIFAMLGASAIGPSRPEWKKIIKIEMTADGPQSTVVQDYTQVPESVQDAIQKAMLESADSDDPPEQQQLLMSAWQAIAMYLSSCDDEDKPGALQALKQVSNLMADGPDDGPMPTGTFGATTQTAAGAVKAKPKDAKDDDTPKGKDGKPLPPWLVKNMNKKKAKDKAASGNTTTYDCAVDGRKFSTMGGLMSHLQSVHNMSTAKAQSAAGKAGS